MQQLPRLRCAYCARVAPAEEFVLVADSGGKPACCYHYRITAAKVLLAPLTAEQALVDYLANLLCYSLCVRSRALSLRMRNASIVPKLSTELTEEQYRALLDLFAGGLYLSDVTEARLVEETDKALACFWSVSTLPADQPWVYHLKRTTPEFLDRHLNMRIRGPASYFAVAHRVYTPSKHNAVVSHALAIVWVTLDRVNPIGVVTLPD